MQKYIEADALKKSMRATLITGKEQQKEQEEYTLAVVEAVIDEAPTADVVSAVRSNDLKHLRELNKSEKLCFIQSFYKTIIAIMEEENTL